MKRICSTLVVAIIVWSTAIPAGAQAADQTEAWRTLAERLEAGSAVVVRLRDGRHFKATFIGAHQDTLMLQRKTRVPVPVEEIGYDSIATLSRVQSSMSG